MNRTPSFIHESTQTVEPRTKTPREFSSAFLHLIDKLVELNWFAEQYPLIKVDVRFLLIVMRNKINFI